MLSQVAIQQFIDGLVTFATDLLMPFMVTMFFAAVLMRGLLFYTIKRQEWFAKEFDRRVETYMEERDRKNPDSFYVLAKRLLEKTYYELFEVRALLKRRKPDQVMAMSDRVFLIKQGTAWMVKDILKQIRFIKHNDHNHPKIDQIARNTFQRNPCFSKVFGYLPGATTNDILNILPGLFIIGGIFGTFLGIMRALPDLGTMDLNDIPGTKLILDQFLLKISFSMSTSIIGIILSVAMSVVNAMMSPQKTFVDTVDRLESSMDTLWHVSSNNHWPEDINNFDEHKDPVEALAEQALDLEFSKTKDGKRLKELIDKRTKKDIPEAS